MSTISSREDYIVNEQTFWSDGFKELVIIDRMEVTQMYNALVVGESWDGQVHYLSSVMLHPYFDHIQVLNRYITSNHKIKNRTTIVGGNINMLL